MKFRLIDGMNYGNHFWLIRSDLIFISLCLKVLTYKLTVIIINKIRKSKSEFPVFISEAIRKLWIPFPQILFFLNFIHWFKPEIIAISFINCIDFTAFNHWIKSEIKEKNAEIENSLIKPAQPFSFKFNQFSTSAFIHSGSNFPAGMQPQQQPFFLFRLIQSFISSHYAFCWFILGCLLFFSVSITLHSSQLIVLVQSAAFILLSEG